MIWSPAKSTYDSVICILLAKAPKVIREKDEELLKLKAENLRLENELEETLKTLQRVAPQASAYIKDHSSTEEQARRLGSTKRLVAGAHSSRF